jgi:hypothetical protein
MLILLIIGLVTNSCFYFIHLKYVLSIHHLIHKHEVKCKGARYMECHVYCSITVFSCTNKTVN